MGNDMMKIKQLLGITLALGLAMSAWAGEKVHHEMKIKVMSDDGDGESVVIDSDDLDFDLVGMQLGESNSIVDKNGRSVLVTRTESGYSFDVDGKTVEMPAFDDFGADSRVWVHGEGEHDVDVDVHVVSDGHAAKAINMEDVIIVSGKEIDPATQQAIRDTLVSAGHGDVRFAGGDGSGERQVKIVKKIHKVHEETE